MSGLVTTRQIRVYGAGGPNEPKFREYNITADVNQTCGALFGPVFDQYEQVFIWNIKAIPLNDGIPEQRLTRDDNLLSVMTQLDMHLVEGVVEIWAENK